MRNIHATRRALTVMGMAGSFFACLALVGASAACAAAPPSSTLFVAPDGSDSAPGSSSAPLRTISAAVAKVPDNGTVVVRTGSYHETVNLSGKTNVRVAAAPGADVWLEGSRVVDTWQQSGDQWVSSGWTARFDSSPTFTAGAGDNSAAAWRFVNPAYPMAAHPDQVWVDGVAQRQVGSPDQVAPGSFYVDYASSRLVLGSNPAGHQVRASDLSKAISIRSANASISGINVRRFAPSVPTMGAVTIERPGVRLDRMSIIDNATSGLQVGSPGATLTNLTLSRNGMMGLRANHADGLTINHVTVSANNLEHFNSAPSAGGAKLVRTQSIRVQNSTFTNNIGTGLWFDESAYDFQVYGSTITGNSGNGLALEISGTARIANNVIADNQADGLKINDTDRVRVWNNTLVGNGRTIDIAQDMRDVNIGQSYRNWDLPLTLRSESIMVRNNVLANPNSSANCIMCVEDHSHRFTAAQLNINTAANVYKVSTSQRPRWLFVWSRGPGNPATYTTLPAMQSSTRQESGSKFVVEDPSRARGYSPSQRVTRLTRGTARPAPRWLAKAAHVRKGTRHLGAWKY